MDRSDEYKLDTEFDQILIKLKPLVVNLNDKAGSVIFLIIYFIIYNILIIHYNDNNYHNLL